MEEDDLLKGWKKTQPKKTPFSNRLIYPTFRTALTRHNRHNAANPVMPS